ncbi:FKBP-type peptidyl-prolyl cis-trans isomerase N-terminal domain-containing protein [Dryocola sp. BD626]|uniref:FKBP-type peptidyl-prolyl cis-trans isomerase N-terminal domain-containing protein n=1 Tax=Dryocola sp. BD626 TaxID=3133273 RepID=UPI003F5097CB
MDTLKKQSADENKKFNDQIRILNKQAAEKLSASETAFRKSQDTNQATKSALQKSDEYNKTLKSQLKDAQTAGQKALEDKEKITQELTKTKKELMSLSLAAITKKDGELISDEVLRIAHSKEGDKTVNSYSVGYILGQAADTKINQVVSSGEQVDRQIVIKGFVDRMNRIANMSKEDMTVALDRLDKSIKRNEATAMAVERRSLP